MDQESKAISLLEASVERYGVGSVKVKDGEVFMFSLKKLQEIVADAVRDGTDRVTIFVKTGPLVSDAQVN